MHRLTTVHTRMHYEQAWLTRELLFMTRVLNLFTPKLLSAAMDLVWPQFWLEYRRYPLVR